MPAGLSPLSQLARYAENPCFNKVMRLMRPG